MDEILRMQRARKTRTPAHLVPGAAMAGEHTFGYFPSARDIRHAERRSDVKMERASINKIWNLYPTITPRMSHAAPSHASHHTSSRHTVKTTYQSLDQDTTLTGVETPEKYDVVNLGAYFRNTDDRRQRHFFISPEWQSEQVTVKRMSKKKQNNPLTYGWI